jgi:filamentous hemagglutinin family protein
MKKNSGVAFPWLGILAVSGILIVAPNQVLAQITPDNTLGDENSVVNTRDETSDSIDGGAVRGQNLFHSFEEFNVDEDRGAYFSNPEAVNNIFSRVTGNNVSNILGTLGVDGTANLFLLNPNGIVFGEGASLDVQGSFAATTADGIEFGEQGFFSAVNPQESRLTISVPLGLQFGSSSGSIINRSFAKDNTDEFVGLQVSDGENLAFIGGDINFETGEATAKSGNIEIGGLSTAGTVGLNANGNLSFPDNLAKADVSLSNAADIDVTGRGGGSINIYARNLDLTTGESGYSKIRAGITADSTSTEAQAGNITLDIAENLLVDEGVVSNLVDAEAVGSAGNIDIQTGNLVVEDGGQINSFTRGQGNAGDVTIQARDTITFNGFDSEDNFSGAASSVQAGGEGNGGSLKITASSLALTNGGQLSASVGEAFDTLPGGKGLGGNVSIAVDDTLTIADGNLPGIFANLGAGAEGSAGNIDIQTGNLVVKNGGQINSFTSGRGNAGDITIQATDSVAFDGSDGNDNYSSASSSVEAGGEGDGGNVKIETGSLSLANGSYLEASVREAFDTLPGGKGLGGNISIDVDDTLTISGENAIGIFATLESGTVGSAGDIDIQTGNLVVKDGGQINSFTRGDGNAGNVDIQANNSITFDGFNDDSFSGVSSSVEAGGEGQGGNIKIATRSLSLTNGGEIDASISGALETLPGGKGQGGKIKIDVDNTLTIAGKKTPQIIADLGAGTEGSGGDIDIQTGNLVVKDGGQISASTSGEGNSGNLSISADNSIALDTGSYIANNVVDIKAVGDAGTIKITTGSLSAKNGSQINSFTRGQGNAGDITIQARDTVTFDGFDDDGLSSTASSVQAGGVGDGGNLKITASSLSLTSGSYLETSIREASDSLPAGKGQGGNININVNDTLTIANGNRPGIFADLEFGAVGSAGNIDIQTGNLVAKNGGQINSYTSGQGNAGDITVQARDTVTFDGFDSNNNYSSAASNVLAGAKGDGGNIKITASSLSLTNGGELNVRVLGALDSDSLTGGIGQGGNVSINVDDTLTIAGENVPGILATLGAGASGNAGDIDVKTGNLVVEDGGQINSFTRGQGNAGDITIQASDTVTFDGFDSNNNYSGASSSVEAGGEGNGGNINITASSLSLTNGGEVDASISEALETLPGGKGQGGNVNINVDDTLTIAGENVPGILATLGAGASGSGGDINIQTGNLVVKNGGLISASTSGQGDSGNLSITADNSIALDTDSTIANNVQDINAVGDAGKIEITTDSLSANKGSQINSFTRGQGNAGDITIQASDTVTFNGSDGNDNYSSAASNVQAGAKGDSGNINITAGSLSLTNGGYVTASVGGALDTLAGGEGEGGNININVDDNLTIAGENAPGIFATLGFGAIGIGGNINITAGDIRLRDDSDIRTDVFGAGDGGNINITADSIVAFDDSDIFAFAPEGKGGNITLNTPAYFGENFTLNSLTSDPQTLDFNSRADVSATGSVSSGTVNIPDVNFIQNSLNTLPNNSLNTNELVANSCVVPVGDRREGKFIITGIESLPISPGGGSASHYATGEVRNVPEKQSSWEPGDPIVEPQGAYRLANGKLVLSRECPR